MSQESGDSSKTETKTYFLKDRSVRILRNVNIRIATLATFIVFVVGATVSIIEMNRVLPISEKLSNSEDKIEDLERNETKLLDDNKKLRREIDKLNEVNKLPTLIFPVDNRPVIGKYCRFKWSYNVASGFKNFVLELRRTGPESLIVSRYPIPEGHTRREIQVQFPELITGQFYWRIGTGELLYKHGGYSAASNIQSRDMGDESFAEDDLAKQKAGVYEFFPDTETRLWSRFGSFSIYKSVWEKLKRTQELVVGTTAAYLSYNFPVDCGGRPASYDMELIEMIAKNLERKLRAEVNVEYDVKFWLRARKLSDEHLKEEERVFEESKRKYLENFKLNVVTKIIDWEDKFTSVINGDVDLTIANISISTTRERKNPGLKFSIGYRDNQQTIIASKLYPPIKKTNVSENQLIAEFEGKNLAVQATSTNLYAAEYLRDELGWGWVIDKKNIYWSYVDVIHQVRSGKAQLGLIDRVRFDSVDYHDLMRIEIDLDKKLKDFYKTRFGTPTEQYGIAVASYGGQPLFRNYLNQAIKDLESERKDLEIKHLAKNRAKWTKESFGCERLQTRPWVPNL